jgi:hypothetical protein
VNRPYVEKLSQADLIDACVSIEVQQRLTLRPDQLQAACFRIKTPTQQA